MPWHTLSESLCSRIFDFLPLRLSTLLPPRCAHLLVHRWCGTQTLRDLQLSEVEIDVSLLCRGLAQARVHPLLARLQILHVNCEAMAWVLHTCALHRPKLRLLNIGTDLLYKFNMDASLKNEIGPLFPTLASQDLPRVITLRLADLRLYDDDGHQLARALRDGALAALRELHVDRNYLSESIAAIVETWTTRPHGERRLSVLEAGYNPIGDDALAHAARALRAALPTLRYVGLGSVQLREPRVVRTLLRMMSRAPLLRELVLECNDIQPSEVHLLVQLLHEGGYPRACFIDLTDNPLPRDQCARLVEQLANSSRSDLEVVLHD